PSHRGRAVLPQISSPTMFGGYRKWFACPGCRRPTRILYGINSLRCWRCRGLKYASQSEASRWRAQRKALSIRRRLSASEGKPLKTESCTDTERKKVQEQIMAYVKAAPAAPSAMPPPDNRAEPTPQKK